MLLWMCLIFFYSSRPADISAQDSGRIGVWIGRTFVPGFEDWPEEKQNNFAESVDYPVRKTAHATEYAILGVLAAGVCAQEKNKSSLKKETGKKAGERAGKYRARGLLLPWLLASAYAATDEIHQLFVPGRSGQMSDVILDSAGALAGTVAFTAVCRFISYSSHRTQE